MTSVLTRRFSSQKKHSICKISKIKLILSLKNRVLVSGGKPSEVEEHRAKNQSKKNKEKIQ
jgi:hypothetical protein